MVEKIDMIFRIIQYVSLGVMFLLFVLELILRRCGKNKVADIVAKAREDVALTATNVSSIQALTIKRMIEVEKRLAFEGDDKKEWVIQKVKADCEEMGLDFNLVNVSEMIEEFIKFSKQVNFSKQEEIKKIIDKKEE